MNKIRKIRLNKKEIEVKKIQLWRVVGFDPVHGMLVVENPRTEVQEGRYLSTGAKVRLPNGQIFVKGWGRDAVGNQIEEVKAIYEYRDPPPKRRQKHHAKTCMCNDCKPYHEIDTKYIDDFGQPGD